MYSQNKNQIIRIEGMEDIIGFVIVAIIMLASFFQNYRKEIQKNKDRTTTNPTKPTTSTSFPPFLGEDEDFLDTDIENDNSTTEAFTKEKDIHSYQPIIVDEFDPFEEGQSSLNNWQNYKPEESSGQEKEVIGQTDASDLQLNTPEDIKRAFIHSLIFERKY